MQKLNAMNDWGIYVSHTEVLNGAFDRSKLEEAGYELFYPDSGCIYFMISNESFEINRPFWFLPIQQPALLGSLYESIDDVAAEVEPLYPEVFNNLSVAERLVRASIVWTE